MKIPIVVFLLTALCSGEEDGPKISTRSGIVQGFLKSSYRGRSYVAYEGVPYAKPPIGDLRFELPQKIQAWKGVLSAQKAPSDCIQYSEFPHDPSQPVEGNEDCLYLNIYVPNTKSDNEITKGPLPVIINIHGGSWLQASGIGNGPKYIMDRDIIYVNFNYRLGPMGFITTGDDVVPGNMGLKDQSMAIKWVKKNIESFGGDPNKITLIGQSAGAASVHYHYLSPWSRNIFNNGISLSGTALDSWSQTENGVEKTKIIADSVGCPTSESKEMISCLKQKPAEPIVAAISKFMPWPFFPDTPLGPVVEKGGDKPFIDRSPAEILDSGDIHDLPWITGIVSEEGLYPLAELAGNESKLKELDEQWDWLAAFILDFNFTIPKSEHAAVAQKIKQEYLQSKPISKETFHDLVKMSGDRQYVVGAEQAARMTAKANKSPVWFYYYTYRANGSFSDIMSNTTKNYGVSHCDDLFMVVDVPFFDPTTSSADTRMQKNLLHFWTSVATNGEPDVGTKWTKVNPESEYLDYMTFEGPDNLHMGKDNDFGRKKFWSTINFNENKIPGKE